MYSNLTFSASSVLYICYSSKEKRKTFLEHNEGRKIVIFVIVVGNWKMCCF